MPPPASPDPDPPVSFLSAALRELESPVDADVLNLAATLGQQHDERSASPFPDAAAVRAEFRRRHELSEQQRLDESRQHLRLLERQQEEAGQRDRLRRAMSRESSAAYGDRVPSRNSLYDWSPTNEADDEDELDQILAELRREQPNTHPEVLRVLGRSQLDSERERIRSISSRLSAERAGSAGESLRSTAILQSVRRHPRFSARTREYLQRYNSEREAAARAGTHSESQARFMSESARQMALQRLADSRTSLDRERRDMLSRSDSYRRNYLDHRTSNPAPAVSPLLEQAVKYLSRIRHSSTIDDSLNCALDAGFLSKDYFSIQYADFITDPSTIPPPAKTSWLAPGAVLSGCQHATSVAATATAAAPGTTASNQFRILDGSAPPLPTLPPPSRPWLANSYSTPRSRTSQVSPEPTAAQLPQQDRWPVKVTIHEVDWDAMTLSATMEAYNVPSHPHQSLLNSYGEPPQQYTRTSSITTYLEGEILDFNKHTLLTESFKSSAANDATYWRKLPPFQKMSDEEVIRALTSKRWYTQVLNKEYILMRWKERCFVKSLARPSASPVLPPPSTTTPSASYIDGPMPSYHSHIQPDISSLTPYRLVRDPATNELQVEIQHEEHATFDDSGCGLTISGFYYTCLRRRDGRLEGLYYDPQSSPYQCLKLESKRGGAVGSWGFR
ncbi:vacuolar import and degradation protein-domain-containing protein [Paraphoma chrysanthemicola]|nr:vacuolar import and degradation protein-domain-containing protein [Paraphoma chrysanthemicola]